MSRRGPHPRPSPLWYWKNWYHSTTAYMARLRIVARNTMIKARRLDTCCGNYGEPGC